MLVRIQKLLNEDQLQLVDKLVESGDFVAGAASTGEPTKAVKNKLQLDLEKQPQPEEFLRMITQLVNSNGVIRSAIVPKKMEQFRFAPRIDNGIAIESFNQHYVFNYQE